MSSLPKDTDLPLRKKASSLDLSLAVVLIALLGDALAAICVLPAAFELRFHTWLSQVGNPEDDHLTHVSYLGYYVFGTLTLIGVLSRLHAYDFRNLGSMLRTGKILLKASVIWFVAFLFVTLFFRFDPPVSRIYGALSVGLMAPALFVWRTLLHRYLAKKNLLTRLRQTTYVMGWTPAVQAGFSRPEESRLCVAGIILPPSGTCALPPPDDYPLIGAFETLEVALKNPSCDTLLLAEPSQLTSDQLSRVATLCERNLVEMAVVPAGYEVLRKGLNVDCGHGFPVLAVNDLPLHYIRNYALKRVIDIAGGLAGLVLAAPFLAVFGILIYRESPGSIFYHQTRVGQYGRRFRMVKLRSMRLDAEQGSKVGWTVRNDPRCLRVGAFMRRWNIDELPQFWNVLKGDMSLVGPRPERPELIASFKESIPHYNARHCVKPGITGWAQVHGLRGDTDLGERVRFDLHYIENWNLLLDLYIMARTLIRRDGAC